MIPALTKGKLPPGVHAASWEELVTTFGNTPWRRDLLTGLRAGLTSLRAAGCLTVYIDGSFVTGKDIPGDFDACWDIAGVDPTLLDPVLLTFADGRAAQKAKYLGEFFPSVADANPEGDAFLDFFQIDKETGEPKGIIALELGGLS